MSEIVKELNKYADQCKALGQLTSASKMSMAAKWIRLQEQTITEQKKTIAEQKKTIEALNKAIK